MIPNLQAAQREMRERTTVAKRAEAMMRTESFRKKIIGVFQEAGYTRGRAEEFLLVGAFGPTIAEVRKDRRLLQELRRKYGAEAVSRICPVRLKGVA